MEPRVFCTFLFGLMCLCILVRRHVRQDAEGHHVALTDPPTPRGPIANPDRQR